MKITPVASTQNVVTDIGGIGSSASGASQVEKIRTMKMSVNRTPNARMDPYLRSQGYEEQEPDRKLAQVEPITQKLPISQNNEPQTAAEDIQPLSPQLALLAKERRALQVKDRELKEREAAIAARTQGSGPAIDIERLKRQPMSVLSELGVTYDTITEEILNGNNSDRVREEMQAKIDAVEKGVDKKLAEYKAQSVKEYLARKQAEATQLVKADDSFELVREWGFVPDAINLMKRIYEDEEIEVSVKEALQAVEDELQEDLAAVTKLKKAQGLFTPQAAPPVQRPQVPQMRTLKNTDTATVPLGRRERAIAAAYKHLNR